MILARVYVGDVAGGPVDYSAIFAETAADALTLPPLNPGESRRVAVRFYDSDTGLEELNTDAQITLLINNDGLDISVIPPGPAGLVVRDTGPGAALVTWQYNYLSDDVVPEYWDVYATPGDIPDYAVPVASVPHDSLKIRFSYELTGYAPGVAVAVAVRSRRGDAHDPNTVALAWIPVGIPTPAAGVTAAAVDYEV